MGERTRKDVLFDIIEKEESSSACCATGTTSSILKIKMWNTITTDFERSTGKKKRLQSMWTRFKDEFRRDGDNIQSKEFTHSKTQTGSGKGDEEPPGKRG